MGSRGTVLVSTLRAKGLRRLCVLLMLPCALLLCFVVADYCFPLKQTHNTQDFAQVVTDATGRPLRMFADNNGVWRYSVTLDQVSDDYITALLHYEDQWFYQHPGINPISLIRASWQWLLTGEPVSGGSTITMQVARLLHPHDKSISGKLYQMFRALQLEWHYDKADILTLYVNYAPFGGTLEGVQAASYRYLDKPAEQLSKAEAALLAVLPQAPSRLRPDRYPERAKQARNKVLQRLLTQSVWSHDEIINAIQEPIYARYHKQATLAPLLSRRLRQQYPQQSVISSTIEMELQAALSNKVADYIRTLPEHTSGAVLVVDNNTMEVKAYLGSANFGDDDRFGHVDMVTALRSPGSTLKPLLFAMALDEGIIHEQSMLLDTPLSFGDYRPQNFSSHFSGLVTARLALQRSLNVPAVQVLDALEPQLFYSRLANAAIPLQLPQGAKPNLSMILGGVGISLEDLVKAYAALGSDGLTKPLRYRSGVTNEAISRRLVSDAASWITVNALNESGLENATDQIAYTNKRRMAYKTGTSYGFRDAWTIATSEQYTIGIWIGRPDGTAMPDNYGRNTAVPLLKQILPLFPQHATLIAEKPANVKRQSICWPLGTATAIQPSDVCLKKMHAWLIDETAPASLIEPNSSNTSSYEVTVMTNIEGKRVLPNCTSSNDYNTATTTLAVWPVTAEPYLPVTQRRYKRIPPLAQDCLSANSSHHLQIAGVIEDALIVKSPLATISPSLSLNANGSEGDIHWYLNGRYQGKTLGTQKIQIPLSQSGENQVNIIDGTGQIAAVGFMYEAE
ncbi:penicillin-binding protein 1C [Alteromonas sp. KUL49]|nr:penicillin-binding protein 1C [Alteromonas sp. KUL49]